MKKLIPTLFILFLGAVFSLNTFAQSAAKVQWTCVPPDSQKVSVTQGALLGLPETSSPGFVVRSYTTTGQTSLGPNQRWWPYENGAAVSWGNETNQVNTRYVQFAATPKPGFSFHADSISLWLSGGGTNMVKANVVLASKPDFSDSVRLNPSYLSLNKDSDSLFSFTLSKDFSDAETLYVRVFPWYTGAPSTSKYLYIQDVNIYGTTKAVALPASALWPLTSTTAFAPTVSGNVTAPDEFFIGTEINGYTGFNASQRIRIKGNTWPANLTSQLDTVYVQFSVSPKSGSSFHADSLSFLLGANSSSTMKANIYYSTDPDFATKDTLKYETGKTGNYLVKDGFTNIFAAPNLEVPDGKTLYLRIYFWNESTSTSSGKYIILQNVGIYGMATGEIVILPPSVTTSPVKNLSNTSATLGGVVSADGGLPVTARGICYNTSGNPTVSDNVLNDTTGSSIFVIDLKNLTPGTKYYVKAFASNSSSTGYGEEVAFTTLDSLSIPAVKTGSVVNILAKTAISGGEVTFDGGLPVTARGICWGTKTDPITSDSTTSMDGEGLGTFKSILYGLLPNTTYYVRAYAANSKGTAYGDTVSFKTQEVAPNVRKIVAKDGSGDYKTFQEAFDAVPDNYTGLWTIFVKKGTYYEKPTLSENKSNVMLQGEDRDSTILTYDDYSGKLVNGTALSTSTCQTLAIDASDFIAKDITIQNTSTAAQAVALRTNGDRHFYNNCRILGYQDTYYLKGGSYTGRMYNKDCYIEGSVDFIFGRNIAVFENCTLNINRNTGTITAASTEAYSKYGLVFLDCKITADSIGFDGTPITSFTLGRPWQAAPRTVFIRCEEPATLKADGWTLWNVPPALYAEYKCTGPGSVYTNRISVGKQLSDEEAALYTIANIFSKDASLGLGFSWVPEMPTSGVEGKTGSVKKPETFSLSQNYPNPFNPATKIQYSLPQASKVKLEIFDVLGKKVATLVNETMKPAGFYSVDFNASHLSSGIYIYTLSTANHIFTKKMMLVK